MRHQGAGALGQARAHGRLGLRARRGQLERRIKRGKTAENRRKIGQARHIRDSLKSKDALCGEDVEWIVEDFGRPTVPFADFGQVVFTGAHATTAGGVVGLDGATVLDISQNNRVLTKSSINGSTVTVTYIEGSIV